MRSLTIVILALLLCACQQTLPMGVDDAPYHPEGWVAEDDSPHGAAFIANSARCQRCHGLALDGADTGVSCESCHSGWQTACTMCHGGDDDQTGAPPPGLAGETLPDERAVGAHAAHLEAGTTHEALDCTTCHVVPESVWDEGHIEGGAGAEVVLGGLGQDGFYDAAHGNCAEVYCHGGGTISWTARGPLGCDACHGDRDHAGDLPGRHGSHLALGVRCADCHAAVIDVEEAIISAPLHVNGAVDLELPTGSWNETDETCATSCHPGGEPATWGNKK